MHQYGDFYMSLLVLRKIILMDDPVLTSSCISNEQEEIQVSSKDCCVFLFMSGEPEVRVDHLAMTEEFCRITQIHFSK